MQWTSLEWSSLSSVCVYKIHFLNVFCLYAVFSFIALPELMVRKSRKAVFSYPKVRNKFESLFCVLEGVSTSETSANFCEITLCSNPAGCHLHTTHRDNLKFRLIYLLISVKCVVNSEYSWYSVSFLMKIYLPVAPLGRICVGFYRTVCTDNTSNRGESQMRMPAKQVGFLCGHSDICSTHMRVWCYFGSKKTFTY
jgi:hypothetical protein